MTDPVAMIIELDASEHEAPTSPTNQSINQSTDQSVNEQSTNQSSKSTNESSSQSTEQSINQSTDHCSDVESMGMPVKSKPAKRKSTKATTPKTEPKSTKSTKAKSTSVKSTPKSEKPKSDSTKSDSAKPDAAKSSAPKKPRAKPVKLDEAAKALKEQQKAEIAKMREEKETLRIENEKLRLEKQKIKLDKEKAKLEREKEKLATAAKAPVKPPKSAEKSASKPSIAPDSNKVNEKDKVATEKSRQSFAMFFGVKPKEPTPAPIVESTAETNQSTAEAPQSSTSSASAPSDDISSPIAATDNTPVPPPVPAEPEPIVQFLPFEPRPGAVIAPSCRCHPQRDARIRSDSDRSVDSIHPVSRKRKARWQWRRESNRPKLTHFVYRRVEDGSYCPNVRPSLYRFLDSGLTLRIHPSVPLTQHPSLDYEYDSDEEWVVGPEEGSDLDSDDGKDPEDIEVPDARLRRDGFEDMEDFMAPEDEEDVVLAASKNRGNLVKSREEGGRTRVVLEPIVIGPYLPRLGIGNTDTMRQELSKFTRFQLQRKPIDAPSSDEQAAKSATAPSESHAFKTAPVKPSTTSQAPSITTTIAAPPSNNTVNVLSVRRKKPTAVTPTEKPVVNQPVTAMDSSNDDGKSESINASSSERETPPSKVRILTARRRVVPVVVEETSSLTIEKQSDAAVTSVTVTKSRTTVETIELSASVTPSSNVN